MFLGSLVPLRFIRQSVFAKRFWGPTPNTPNVPINCRDFGMVCLGAVCSSVGAAGRAYNLRGAIPVIAPLFTFIVKHYANDVPVTLATFPCSRARSEGFPRQRVIICVVIFRHNIVIIGIIIIIICKCPGLEPPNSGEKLCECKPINCNCDHCQWHTIYT